MKKVVLALLFVLTLGGAIFWNGVKADNSLPPLPPPPPTGPGP
jgi:hypothetical protein